MNGQTGGLTEEQTRIGTDVCRYKTLRLKVLKYLGRHGASCGPQGNTHTGQRHLLIKASILIAADAEVWSQVNVAMDMTA